MRVAILTVSDSVSRGQREDVSGPAVRERCEFIGWEVIATDVVPDDLSEIQARLATLADSGQAEVIFTTGGTGLGPRDVTPEATSAVCSRLIPGLAELMRQSGARVNPRALLSRGVVGVRGQTIIVNLPGSPRGAIESFDAVNVLLDHALEVLRGASHE